MEIYNYRVSIDAELALKSIDEQTKAELEKKIAENNLLFLTKEKFDEFIAEIEWGEKIKKQKNEEKVEVLKTAFNPIAKEYPADIKVKHDEDITGKSRSRGTVDDFVNYFRNRFLSYRSLFRNVLKDYEECRIEDLKKEEGKKIRLFAMVYDKGMSKKGNVVLTLEDPGGMATAIISSNMKPLKFKESESITKDDILMFYGRVVNSLFIIEEFDFPDVQANEFPHVEKDIAIAYLSDIHFGSRFFRQNTFERFVKWLNGKEGNEKEQKLAGKVKYVIVAGDVVDGVGIYPMQEKELVVKDIYKQYELFDEFVNSIPDYIKVIVNPGNHDATRRAEPMPAIGKDFIKSDVISLGNPATLEIESIKHLVYHGTSMDSLIATVPGLSYSEPKDVMAVYIKKRHLSPLYGENPIVPEHVDYMLMRTLPNVVHTGHVHKFAKGIYKNIALINSATFQDQTDFQVKQGHIPTPGVVPVLELKHSKIEVLDFKKPQIMEQKPISPQLA